MFRINEKEDLDTKIAEVEQVIKQWRADRETVAEAFNVELRRHFRISLIHHDAALESEVLSFSEIKAALDPAIVRAAINNPTYAPIKRYHDALTYAIDFADGKEAIRMEAIRKIHSFLAPEIGSGTASYRKENPLHRLYYHSIAAPEKIAYQMRKLGEWMDEDEREEMHPAVRAARTHHKLMQVFPWTKETGRCARILSNLILLRHDWPLTIIHSIDRQKYYEALKSEETEGLEILYLDSVMTIAKSSLQAFEEAIGQGLSRASEAAASADEPTPGSSS